MANRIGAFLIDMDGVLYEGTQAVPGARDAIEWLDEASLPHLFLTNTTSRPRAALIDKLGRMGIHAEAEQILTPPVAASHWLSTAVEGPVALFVPPATLAEFGDLEVADLDAADSVAAVVIGDYAEGWSFARLNRAFRWLMEDPERPLVALGMTRYWRADDGLRLDTGPFVTALEYATGREAVVLGKPARPFFEAALTQLGVSTMEACMIGDDICGDVGGAQAAGIRGVLVKTGKFRPEELKQDIKPAAVLDSIADLPAWWHEQFPSDHPLAVD